MAMASSDHVKTALLTEHFRYTPLTLLDDIINTVNELVFQAVNAVEEGLMSANHEALGFTSDNTTSAQDEEGSIDPAARTEIEAGIVQLESLLNATIDKNFDKLEIYTLRNLLTVSNRKEDDGLENWVLLDHYKNLDHATPSDAGKQHTTPQSLQLLRRKVQETEKLHAALRAETARNDALLARLRPLVATPASSSSQQHAFHPQTEDTAAPASFAFLTSVPAAQALGISKTNTTQPLAQNTQFALSQLPALKSLLAGLKPHLASLPLTVGPSGPAAAAREAYVEAQSRRAMQRGGVEPNASAGAVVDELGRRAGGDEVRALEGIVGALGGRVVRGDRMEE